MYATVANCYASLRLEAEGKPGRGLACLTKAVAIVPQVHTKADTKPSFVDRGHAVGPIFHQEYHT